MEAIWAGRSRTSDRRSDRYHRLTRLVKILTLSGVRGTREGENMEGRGMKYGWVCKKCGGWIHSDDKGKVSTSKKEHKRVGCMFFKGKDGVLRRPGL